MKEISLPDHMISQSHCQRNDIQMAGPGLMSPISASVKRLLRAMLYPILSIQDYQNKPDCLREPENRQPAEPSDEGKNDECLLLRRLPFLFFHLCSPLYQQPPYLLSFHAPLH